VSTHLLLEAAMRSLVMGAIIFAALRLLRIEHVRTRRTAWLLALAGALAMPLLVAAQIGPRLLPEISFAHRPSVEALTVAPRSYGGAALRAAQDSLSVDHGSSLDHPAYSVEDKGNQGAKLAGSLLLAAAIGYCVVAVLLALRLCAGVGFALRLKNQAHRVVFAFDPELDTRASARIASPVTVGSSVLLPTNHTLWDGTTLRIVLSHERAHVRQKDFYVQMLAGLHCALFWFNPFSWWLQRQLSELGEALSDCAAVEQAESRASYAETLLAFATRAHSPMTGVAMASASNLSPRIDRLLSDRGFERSFAPKQRLPFIAAAVVAAAMFASTSMVRVHAGPANGPLNANTVSIDAAAWSTSTADTSSTVDTSSTSPTAAASATTPPAATSAPATATPATRPAKKKTAKVKQESADADGGSFETNDAEAAGDSHEEGILAIHSGHSRIMIDSGDSLPQLGGDYIYFQHDGKPYLIQDPQIIAKAQALLEPMQELREKQRELGRQQRLLGTQQRMLVAQNRSIKMVQTPEFKRQIEELQKSIKEMDFPRLTGQIDERALAEVQSHLGEIQARVGELQSQFGRMDGQFGEQEGKLGEQQGKLGEQQALLGEQQQKIVEDARRQLKPIIEQAIREGKGKPLSTD
jgi:bla regulator protein blaR1